LAWILSLADWLVHAAVISLPIFINGSLAVLCCRQPVRRIWLIELTLAGCLAAPWLGLIPGWPQWSVSWPVSAVPHEAVDAPPTEAIRPSSFAAIEPHDDRPAEIAGTASELPAAAIGIDGRSSEPLSAPLKEGVEQSHAAERQVLAARFDVRPWIAAVWFLGAACLGVWWLAGIVGLARLLRQAQPAPAGCREVLSNIAGPEARVTLLQSDRIELPFACLGLRLQPLIVLPARLCAGPPHDDSALCWCLAHEWSHVERRDLWAWMLAGLVRMLFFYHPLAWWLRRQLRLDQDYIADARAAEQASEPEDYAVFLTAQALTGSRRIAAAGLGIGGGKSDLYRRVTMLVQDTWCVERRCPRLWAGTIGVAALGLLAAASMLRFTADGVGQSQNEPRTAQVQPEADAKPVKPQLQFVASPHRPPKRGEDDGSKPLDGIYWSPDGRLVTDQDRLRPLRELAGGGNEDLYLFVSHPHLPGDAYGRIDVLDADGNVTLKRLLGIMSFQTSAGKPPEWFARGWTSPGWMVFRIHPPEPFNLPNPATVRLRYAISEEERTPFPVETRIGDDVGDVRIIGIGNNKDGRAFVSYLVPRDRAEKFQYLIKSRPGPGFGSTLLSRSDDSHHIVTTQFRLPLEDIEEFELWTREIESVTFENVALRPKTE
jgi:beta-lactamase regulating signal transducer with metallopeptidase domain